MSNEKNINIGDLINKIKDSDKPTSQQEVNSFLDENLSSSQAQAVKELLGDKDKTRRLLESDAAKSLFNKFFGGKGNV